MCQYDAPPGLSILRLVSLRSCMYTGFVCTDAVAVTVTEGAVPRCAPYIVSTDSGIRRHATPAAARVLAPHKLDPPTSAPALTLSLTPRRARERVTGCWTIVGRNRRPTLQLRALYCSAPLAGAQPLRPPSDHGACSCIQWERALQADRRCTSTCARKTRPARTFEVTCMRCCACSVTVVPTFVTHAMPSSVSRVHLTHCH